MSLWASGPSGPIRSGAFDYEAYFAHYRTDPDIVVEDAWKIYYRELLRMHNQTVVHIVDGNLLDENRLWKNRERRFRDFLTPNLPIPSGRQVQDVVGRLYAAHGDHFGRARQPHNIEGAGFAYLTRTLLLRFCGLSPDQVRIGPVWTSLPGYVHLAGGPDVPKIKPDIAVLKAVNGRPDTHGVVSLKWTIRHDRLKNTLTEAQELRNRKRGGRPTYVAFLTNEFSIGRLRSAADSPQINCVYHVSLNALSASYVGETEPGQEIQRLRADGVLKDVSALFSNMN